MNSKIEDSEVECHVFVIAFGIILLLFRIWIVEIKLREELQFRRRYFSRFFSYYTCLALVFGLGAYPLNIIVMIAFPILLVTSIWDINFYCKVGAQAHWIGKNSWAILERLTLHPPVVVVALFMIINDAQNYIQPPNLLLMIISVLILIAPFFFVDVRWTQRYKWPEALVVIGLFAASGISLLLAESLLWHVPFW